MKAAAQDIADHLNDWVIVLDPFDPLARFACAGACAARSFSIKRRRRLCPSKKPGEVFPTAAQADKVIGYIAAFPDLARKLYDLCVRNESRDTERTGSSGFVVIEATVHFGNGFELLGPILLNALAPPVEVTAVTR